MSLSILQTSMIWQLWMVGLSLVHGACQFPTPGANDRELHMQCTGNVIQFASLADWGIEYNRPYTQAIVDSLHAHKDQLDFIYAGGDNFYDKGVVDIDDFRWHNTWYARFHVAQLNLPWLAVLGNHDYHQNVTAQVLYHEKGTYGAKYWHMPNTYYALQLESSSTPRQLKMAFLDTERLDKAQYQWMQSQLTNPNDVQLVLGHRLIYSRGFRGDARKMRHLDSLLQLCRVDAYICGHEHDLQYLKRHDIDYFLVGGGGGSLLRPPNFFGSRARKILYKRTHGYTIHQINLQTKVMTTTFYFFNKKGQSTGTAVFTSNY